MANENLVDATRRTQPALPDEGTARAHARNAPPKDTDPPRRPAPAVTGVRARQALALNGGVVFLDKIGERLAFERSTVRLYEALLSKHDAWGSWGNGPRRAELEKIRDDELEHLVMLQQVLQDLGADVAAVVTAANPRRAYGTGVPSAIADTRASLRDGLEAILVAELVDNDCWENLSDLASALHRGDLADRFEEALAQECGHVSLVRRWLGMASRPGAGDQPRRGET